MMSSSGTSRGANKHNKTKTTHHAHQQNKTQNANNTDTQAKNLATAEQLRLASLISDKHGGEDPELQKKVKQVMDVTGREEEEIIVALHDCDNDTNRAINLLLEGGNDQGEWRETSSKKKKKQPASTKSENVINDLKPEKREKSKDRDREHINDKFDKYDKFDKFNHDKPDRDRDNYNPRDRRNKQPPRLARKNREMRENRENMENERNDSESRDRGGRGRGRGGQMNGPSRGRGRGRGGFRGNRFDRERERGPQIDTWTNETAANAEKENNTWGDGVEDWTADEWTGSLEESKVFTASSNAAEPQSNKSGGGGGVFGGMGDNDAKMFTPPVSVVDSFSSTFTALNAATNGAPALNDTTNTLHTGSSLINSISQSPIGTRSSEQLGQKLDLSMLLNKKPESEPPSQAPSQFSRRLDLGMLLQSKPTVDPDTASQQQFMSQLTKHSSEVLKNAIGIGNSVSSSQPSSTVSTSSSVVQAPRSSQMNVSPLGSTTQLNTAASQSAANSRPKLGRTKLPPPSKIPASAVEMPGHIGSFQLDVQFGNLDFGNEGGFNIGSDKSSASSATTASVLNNHIGHLPKSSVESSTSNHSVMAAASSVISSVSTTTPSSITGLDVISQNLSSPRPGMYPSSAPSTPRKEDYSAEISQNKVKMTPPEPIPSYASQERKSSPHYPTRTSQQTSTTMNSNKSISSPPYSQSYSSSGYNSTGYQPQKAVTTASYSHSNNSLNSQYGNHGNTNSHQSYHQSNSFQSQNSYNNSGQTSNSSSLYQSGSASSSAYQGPSGSSYSGQSSSSYPNQTASSSSYQNTGYQSRDSSQTAASYQPSISQTASVAYEPANQSTTSYNSTASSQSSNNSSYQRDGQSNQSSYGSHQSYGSSSHGNHQNNLQTSTMSTNKLNDSINKMSVKDSTLDTHQPPTQHSYDTSSVVTTTSTGNLVASTITTTSSLSSVNVSSALGLSTTASVPLTSSVSSMGPKTSLPNVSKAPPNLPPGVPIVPGNYHIQYPFIGIPAATGPSIYNYDDLQAQLMAQRGMATMPGYYDMQLQPTPSTMTGREQNSLANIPYTAGADGKLNRVEAQSPVQAQTSTQQHNAGTTQQAYINPAAPTLPPGYNYYTFPSNMIPGYQYTTPTAVFPVGNIQQVPAVTQTAQHAGATTGATLYQKPAGNYGTYATTGYEDLSSQTQDFNKYGAATVTQSTKASAASASISSNADLAATYAKTHSQSFDKTAGFHHGGVGGTPPPFSLPLNTVTQAGPMGAPTAAAAYPTSYVQMMQPSQMLHHHLQQDSTGGSSRAAAQTTAQPKAAAKGYGAAAYWGAN